MLVNYKPKNKLEKFGVKVYSALVENFSQTFFVGGMVRDILLKREVVDVDIATAGRPDEIIKILSQAGISTINDNKIFGNIIAKQGGAKVDITTFRTDVAGPNRYNYVLFVTTPKQDSKRRDFTINSLYLRLKDNRILDFNGGLADIRLKRIKFIGQPKKRIAQDPLRIIRALRFALTLNLKLESKTKLAIKNNSGLINNLTRTKIRKEINKIKNRKHKIILQKVINRPNLLDKYFK